MTRTMIAAAGATALVGAAALHMAQPAGAQAAMASPVSVAATTVGNVSHAWIVDPGTRQIVHCRADNAALRECKALPMPGAAAR